MCRIGRIGFDGLGGEPGRDGRELLARYTYTLEMTLTKLKYVPRIPQSHFISTFCFLICLETGYIVHFLSHETRSFHLSKLLCTPAG